MIAEDYRHIQQALSFNLPPVHIDTAVQPTGYGGTNANFHELDFGILVSMRQQHQTRPAAMGVRTKGDKQLNPKKDISIRRQFIQRFHEVLKEEQDRAPCTGSDRQIHWRAPAPGGRGGQVDGLNAPALANGNSANAAVSASAVAKKVRQYLFLDAFVVLTFVCVGY
jgi:hypothetical protein